MAELREDLPLLESQGAEDERVARVVEARLARLEKERRAAEEEKRQREAEEERQAAVALAKYQRKQAERQRWRR